MHLAVSPQSFSVLRQHIVYTAAMATILAELSTVFASESSFWKCVLVFVCLYEMHVSSFMWVHACAYVCEYLCACVVGRRAEVNSGCFLRLLPTLSFEMLSPNVEFPHSAAPLLIKPPPHMTSCSSLPGAGHTDVCSLFTWALGSQTQICRLVWQNDRLSHLPSS